MIGDMLSERIDLAISRLSNLIKENEIKDIYADYFKKQADFLLLLYDVCDSKDRNLSDLKSWNTKLYEDILPQNYESSYTNPDYACKKFGREIGQCLCLLAAEIRSVIGYAYENNYEELLIRIELLLEIYGSFLDSFNENEKEPEYKVLREIIYWYVSDYSDEESLRRVYELVNPDYDFARNIVLNADLSVPDYLYQYGEYVNDDTIKLSKYMATLPEEKIDLIASTYTEGYRIGFINTGKDLSIKDTVNIRYPLGMERVVRKAVFNFEKMGLKSIIYRASNSLFRRQGTNKIGYYGANPNKQYDFDHKEDEALFIDGNFITRKLECLERAFETYKERAAKHAGPAVIEDFGQEPVSLETKENSLSLDFKQQELSVRLLSKSGAISNKYIKGEERSFTIIAFPSPAIGHDFEKIFDETIRINTLDYKLYETIQQCLIDTLDKGKSVHIQGMNGNRTDLTVALIDIKNGDKETKFENCVADVNIPVGEVFTSPRLKGTNGILNVSMVFLNGLLYKNLELEFQNGMIENYSCDNYDDSIANKKYIKDNVLFHHDSLPMGEFAIGTNTYAYVVGKKYNIQGKLPILIAEKTGPHFAVGDTCYSHAEDIKVYNPNKKEIMARDNEISVLRKTDIDKAYFNCHTDITIPYDELALLEVIMEDGSRVSIIENGIFVLKGCEELNLAFNNIDK